MIAGGVKPAFDAERDSLGILSSSSIVAHELKSPLAIIRQLALEIEDQTLSDAQRTTIAYQIRLLSEQSMRLSSDIAATEQMQAELFPTRSINPQAICLDVMQTITPLYKAQQRKIILKPRKRPLLGVANPDLLRRVMLNFVDNALHYTDESSVVELYTQLVAGQNSIRIGVRDYGVPISRRVAHVVPDRVSSAPIANGLGLSIAHRFAEVFGGTIGATRHRNGTSFYIDVMVSKQLSLL